MATTNLTIEEKAKRYDDALRKVKETLDSLCDNYICNHLTKDDVREMYANLFPELAESEDEKVRKELISLVKETKVTVRYYDLNKMLTWLEKQGTDISSFPKKQQVFMQKYVSLDKITLIKLLAERDANNAEIIESFEKQGEQKPAWSEEDEKFVHGLIRGLAAKRDIHGHTTFSSDCIDITETINWLKSLKDRVQPQPKQEWSEDDERFLNVAINILNSSKVYTKSPDKYEDTINWLKSLRPQLQQKWSEKDERVRIALFLFVEAYGSYANYEVTQEEMLSWLKSLRPQNNVTDEELAQAKKDAYNDVLDKLEYDNENPTFDDGWSAAIWYLKKRNAQPQNRWKPSDEQMEALEDAIRYGEEEFIGILSLLYNDLKKLKE